MAKGGQGEEEPEREREGLNEDRETSERGK